MEDREYKAKILVADDEEVVRDILKTFLISKGYDVQTAENGIEAVKKLREYEPDILLLDLKMPDMDGVEVMKHIRSNGLKVAVIIITGHPGYVRDDNILACAYDYIIKPFDLDYLNSTVLAKVMMLVD